MVAVCRRAVVLVFDNLERHSWDGKVRQQQVVETGKELGLLEEVVAYYFVVVERVSVPGHSTVVEPELPLVELGTDFHMAQQSRNGVVAVGLDVKQKLH